MMVPSFCPHISWRAFLPAVAAITLLGGCDRQDTPKGQDAGGTDTKTAAPAAEAGKAEYTIDRSHKGTSVAARFTGPDDARVSVGDFAGKPLVLNLWATWCTPCKAEMPQLDALAGKGAASGAYRVIVVSQDSQGAAAVDPYFATSKFAQLQPFLDVDNALLTETGGEGLPLTLLIDATGKEVLRVVGPLDWTGDVAAGLIAELTK